MADLVDRLKLWPVKIESQSKNSHYLRTSILYHNSSNEEFSLLLFKEALNNITLNLTIWKRLSLSHDLLTRSNWEVTDKICNHVRDLKEPTFSRSQLKNIGSIWRILLLTYRYETALSLSPSHDLFKRTNWAVTYTTLNLILNQKRPNVFNRPVERYSLLLFEEVLDNNTAFDTTLEEFHIFPAGRV